jgi:hypothetical protein
MKQSKFDPIDRPKKKQTQSARTEFVSSEKTFIPSLYSIIDDGAISDPVEAHIQQMCQANPYM